MLKPLHLSDVLFALHVKAACATVTETCSSATETSSGRPTYETIPSQLQDKLRSSDTIFCHIDVDGARTIYRVSFVNARNPAGQVNKVVKRSIDKRQSQHRHPIKAMETRASPNGLHVADQSVVVLDTRAALKS